MPHCLKGIKMPIPKMEHLWRAQMETNWKKKKKWIRYKSNTHLSATQSCCRYCSLWCIGCHGASIWHIVRTRIMLNIDASIEKCTTTVVISGQHLTRQTYFCFSHFPSFNLISSYITSKLFKMCNVCVCDCFALNQLAWMPVFHCAFGIWRAIFILFCP